MATITITIADEHMPRVVDALCIVGGWRSVELDGARGAFAKKVVMDYVRSTTREVEHQTALAAAKASVQVPSEVTIT